MWHALEENEHKAVAYDVYNLVGGGYFTRVLTMLVVTLFSSPWSAFRSRMLWSGRQAVRYQRQPERLLVPGARKVCSRNCCRSIWISSVRASTPNDHDTVQLLDDWREKRWAKAVCWPTRSKTRSAPPASETSRHRYGAGAGRLNGLKSAPLNSSESLFTSHALSVLHSSGNQRSSTPVLVADGEQIRRRRECISCGERFTTFETAELVMPRIIKQNGTREPFNEEKLHAGILRALENPPSVEDAALTRIKQRLRGSGEREVPSRMLGECVMSELRQLDEVALRALCLGIPQL